MPASPTTIAPSGIVACFLTPGAKSAYERRIRSANARERASIRASRSESTTQRPPGREREQLDRAVVVGRAEAARDDEQLAGEPLPQGRFDVVCSVTDDPDLGRLDPEREQRAREKRPVPVVAVAADELRAGDDDRRAYLAQSGCTPLGVTVSACGRYPESGMLLPPTVITRFSGELTSSQKRLPANGSTLPRSIVPWKRIFPAGPPLWTATYDGPLTAAIWR